MGRILIKRGRLVNPADGTDKVCDILIDDGKIAEIAEEIPGETESVLDASGKIVMPGLINTHSHVPMRQGRRRRHTVVSPQFARCQIQTR